MHRTSRDSSPSRNLQQEGATAFWRFFFVTMVGNTNGAHDEFVNKLKGLGHTEVKSLINCDYVVMFCPITSRVGTDISEAMNRVPAGKPFILVVMHHTFNSEYILADNKRLVTNLNVHLTVDLLFYEHRFLNCKRNNDAWSEVERFLRVSRVSLWKRSINLFRTYWRAHWKPISFGFVLIGFVGIYVYMRSTWWTELKGKYLRSAFKYFEIIPERQD